MGTAIIFGALKVEVNNAEKNRLCKNLFILYFFREFPYTAKNYTRTRGKLQQKLTGKLSEGCASRL
jgi:hypothetical protein